MGASSLQSVRCSLDSTATKQFVICATILPWRKRIWYRGLIPQDDRNLTSVTLRASHATFIVAANTLIEATVFPHVVHS